MYRIMPIVLVLACAASTSSARATEATAADSTARECRLTTAEEAVSRALEVTGFGELKGVDTTRAK